MKLLFLLLFFPLINLNAQSISEQDLIGDWSATKLHPQSNNVPEEIMQQISVIHEAFLNSKFLFKENHLFSFDTPIDDLKKEKAFWDLNPQTGTIEVSDTEEKNSPMLMEITVIKEDGKIFFMIEETFFTYEVKKNE